MGFDLHVEWLFPYSNIKVSLNMFKAASKPSFLNIGPKGRDAGSDGLCVYVILIRT